MVCLWYFLKEFTLLILWSILFLIFSSNLSIYIGVTTVLLFFFFFRYTGSCFLGPSIRIRFCLKTGLSKSFGPLEPKDWIHDRVHDFRSFIRLSGVYYQEIILWGCISPLEMFHLWIVTSPTCLLFGWCVFTCQSLKRQSQNRGPFLRPRGGDGCGVLKYWYLSGSMSRDTARL